MAPRLKLVNYDRVLEYVVLKQWHDVSLSIKIEICLLLES